MPRKGPAPKRPLVNDPVYGSQLVTQLVNKVLMAGKKSLAERIVYAALEQARDKTGTDPVITLKRALDNVKPALEVRSRRVGWCHLPGARRGASGPVHHAGAALAGQLLAATPGEDDDRHAWPTRSWMPSNASGLPSSDVKTRTRWPRQTAPSRITAVGAARATFGSVAGRKNDS